MIKDILEVARALFDRRDVIIRNRKEKCDLLAKYFEGISDTLQQLADSVKAGHVSQGTIAQLATYADMLPPTVGSNLQLIEMEELTQRLKQAHDLRALSSEPQDKREEGISQIEEASGVFKALGASCRIHY